MGLFKDMVNNIKQIVVSDDEDNIFINDDVFEQEEKRNVGIPTLPKLPFSNKQKNKPSSEMNNNQNNIGFDLNSFSMNSNRTDGQSKKLANKGHIQIYLPKNYEQVFDVIRDVRQGITAMVNVESCNPQIALRIIDTLSGALYALNGQCKKMGEKQYIFSLNAEMSGAVDYLPGNGNQNMGQYGSFNAQNPFSSMDYMSNNGFNQNNDNNYFPNDNFNNQQFGNNMNQTPFNNQNPYNNQNNNYNQNNNINQNNNQNNNRGFNNFNDFYVPPQNQF